LWSAHAFFKKGQLGILWSSVSPFQDCLLSIEVKCCRFLSCCIFIIIIFYVSLYFSCMLSGSQYSQSFHYYQTWSCELISGLSCIFLFIFLSTYTDRPIRHFQMCMSLWNWSCKKYVWLFGHTQYLLAIFFFFQISLYQFFVSILGTFCSVSVYELIPLTNLTTDELTSWTGAIHCSLQNTAESNACEAFTSLLNSWRFLGGP
jgi:hypothetical protein